MKEVFSQFGTVMISIVVASALFALIGVLLLKSGVRGVYAEAGGSRYLAKRQQEYIRLQKFNEYNRKKSFTVTYLPEHPLFTGESIALSQHFRGEDADGKTVELTLEKIVAGDGSTSYYAPAEQYDCPETPGVYEFYVKGKTEVGRNQSIMLRIPVQEKV